MDEKYDLQRENAKTMIVAVYILTACTYFAFIPAVVGIIIAYIKRGDVKEEWINDHFTWQINTLWVIMVGSIVSVPLCFVAIGFLLLGILLVWGIYRVVKGLIRYNDQKSPYE